MAWYDFNNSGGLDFGDIGAGLNQAYEYGKGLLGSAGTVDALGNRTGTSGLSGFLMDNKGLIDTTGGLIGTIGDWQTSQAQKDYAQGLLSLEQAKTDAYLQSLKDEKEKEELAQLNMQQGFATTDKKDSYFKNFYEV